MSGPTTGAILRTWRALLPGLLLSVAVAAVAATLHTALARGPGSPGPAVLALVLGVVLTAARAPGASTAAGLRFASSRLLQAGIVVLGLTVPLAAVVQVGPRALPVVVVAVVTAFAVGSVLGRALGVGQDLRTLISAGTGICGASAVAATAGVLRARPADVSYALSAVVVMNLLAVLGLPVLARALALSDEGFGAWVGAAVNDTSAVVAVAGGWSAAALTVAVVTKLTRVLALVPVVLLLARLRSRADADPAGGRVQLVPPFLLLFVLAVALAATGSLPEPLTDAAGDLVVVLVTLALAAVGCSTRVREVARAGWAPVALAALVWVSVAAAALTTLLLVGLG